MRTTYFNMVLINVYYTAEFRAHFFKNLEDLPYFQNLWISCFFGKVQKVSKAIVESPVYFTYIILRIFFQHFPRCKIMLLKSMADQVTRMFCLALCCRAEKVWITFVAWPWRDPDVIHVPCLVYLIQSVKK